MSVINIKKVLLLDGIDPVCGELLTKAGISVTQGKLSKDELLAEISKYDAIVVRSATKVTAEVLAAGKNLQLVGRAGTGTDNIDSTAATRQGVIVMNTPGGNTLSAAEHTCALICSLGRFLPQACASLKAGAWDRKKYMGNELYGKTLAVVGLGRIGREVSSRMQSFGMKVIGYDPFVPKEVAAQWNIDAMPLEEIWPKADYITVHTPLLPHTRNLVGREVLNQKCKEGVKIINVARGGIVDEEALLEALESGRCGGAGLDVFIEEPPLDFKLCQHPKVVCTPHLGANTKEAQKRVAEEIAEQIVSGMSGKPLQGLVNAEALAMAGNEDARRWISLAKSLGQLSALVSPPQQSTTVELQSFGDQSKKFVKATASGALSGYLQKSSNGASNLVNATLLSSDYGVTLKGASSAPATSSPLLSDYFTIEIKSPSGTSLLSGSVAGGNSVLLSINGSKWEFPVPLPQGSSLLLFSSAASSPSALSQIVSSVSEAKLALTSVAVSKPEADTLWYLVTCGKINGEANIKVAGCKYLGQANL